MLPAFSVSWNTGTNPDLASAIEDLNSSKMDSFTLEKFPRSPHQSILIAASKNLASVPSEPYKLWNVSKANWKVYGLITNQLFQ